jgi:hypothetical protein
LVAPDLDRDTKLQQAIKHLAFDVKMAAAQAGLQNRIPSYSGGQESLAQTVFGLLSPERRIFRDRKKGGAGKEGSFFPIVGGLIAPTGSDDSLGRRLRELMEPVDSDWQSRLVRMFLPTSSMDPATAFATVLLGGESGHAKSKEQATHKAKKKLSNFDRSCAEFVDNLITPQMDARRVSAIRNLATGSYLISVIEMIAGVCAVKKKSPPFVFAYGGLPPGESDDPVVRAACQSFQSWVSTSWQATAEAIVERMDATGTLPKSETHEKREQQIRQLLSDRQKNIDDTIDVLKPFFKRKSTGPTWARHVMESKQIAFSKTEFIRRIRVLGANIGFVGPDRGTGNPRLFFDTPILGVIVKGVIGKKKSMDFRSFVTELAQKFGLVIGVGADESIADKVGIVGSGGFDPDEMLSRNQENFRERLVRVGLARTYSDSHTEVVADV